MDVATHARGNHTNNERPELGGGTKRGVSRIQATFLARHGEGKIGTHAHEQEERQHLE